MNNKLAKIDNNQNNTKELIRKELVKIITDSVHFMKNYCYIQHPIKGRIKFNLYPFQEDTIKTVTENRFNIILKARQMGISTLLAGYILWMILFHKDKNVLVVAIKMLVAQNLITKIRVMYENLPKWLRDLYVLRSFNKTEIEFATGSHVKAVPMTEDAGRSEALSLLVIDECVKYDTTITVRNKITGIVENVKIGDLYHSFKYN